MSISEYIYIRSVNCYWSKLKWISFGLVFICNFLIWAVKYRRCTIKIFIGGVGVVDGWGANSERCLKWGVGGH